MKLLIADDEIQVRKGLAEAIDWSQCGINTVLTAANGVEALDICKIQRPEVVLTDIRMPGCDGLQLAKEIINLYALVRVIILSGYSEFKYAQQAVKIGVKDFLLKPIDIDELIQVVSECVHSVCEQRDNAIFHMRMAENASPFRGLSREVELVVDHITQHYAENISLGDMAAMVGKSRNYFSSLFKKETGISFMDYVTKVRVAEAQRLLSTTDMLTTEIAEAVGYSDYKYFSKVFRKATGMPPSHFRKPC